MDGSKSYLGRADMGLFTPIRMDRWMLEIIGGMIPDGRSYMAKSHACKRFCKWTEELEGILRVDGGGFE